jgi:hypothetical protein
VGNVLLSVSKLTIDVVAVVESSKGGSVVKERERTRTRKRERERESRQSRNRMMAVVVVCRSLYVVRGYPSHFFFFQSPELVPATAN